MNNIIVSINKTLLQIVSLDNFLSDKYCYVISQENNRITYSTEPDYYEECNQMPRNLYYNKNGNIFIGILGYEIVFKVPILIGIFCVI